MLTFKDFMPEVQKKILGFPTDYESIHEVLTRVKRWIEREQIQIINVETLLLPSMPSGADEAAPARMTAASNSMGTFQVIRVWHYESPPHQSAMTGVTVRLAPLDPAGTP
ncbi:MAG TPA: hypothetical protein VD886_07675 [Herpetosiphonaceae bacterium]|nr:hypothetical protein [Herpetosiphonaceae bacterium]